jgi:hypothetical protein
MSGQPSSCVVDCSSWGHGEALTDFSCCPVASNAQLRSATSVLTKRTVSVMPKRKQPTDKPVSATHRSKAPKASASSTKRPKKQVRHGVFIDINKLVRYLSVPFGLLSAASAQTAPKAGGASVDFREMSLTCAIIHSSQQRLIPR